MTKLNLEIKAKLDALQDALLTAHPTMPTLLRDIHSTLKSYPEQVTLMDEDEINVIIRGLEKQTNTYIASTVTKPKTATKRAALKSTTAEDLGF